MSAYRNKVVHVSPVQWVIRLRDDEEPIHSIKYVPHGDVGVVAAIKYVVADAANTVDIAVVYLPLC